MVLRFAEWSVSGIVRDGIGKPVAQAWVTVEGILVPIADATTDASGRYRITSTAQHVDAIHVKASIPGYISQYTIVTCGPSCVTEFDDGSRTTAVTRLESSNPAVVTVLPSQPPYEATSTSVKAIAPGTGTLQTAGYTQPLLLLNVRVVP